MSWVNRPANLDAPGQVHLGIDLQTLMDQVEFLTSPPLAVLTRNASFTVANGGSGVLVDFDTAEIDTYGWWDATAPSHFAPQIAGYYTISGLVGFAPNASGVRAAWLNKSGTDINGTQQKLLPISGVVCAISTGTRVVFCNGSTDYIGLGAFQNTGAGLGTSTEPNNYPMLCVQWKGAA